MNEIRQRIIQGFRSDVEACVYNLLEKINRIHEIAGSSLQGTASIRTCSLIIVVFSCY